MYYFSAILYYGLMLPISYLPFRVLYALSDGFSWFLFNVTGYRKKVVLENLRNSFPEKTETEIQDIARKFYTHFCDLIFESVKFFTITYEELTQRFICTNRPYIDSYFAQGRSIIVPAGHYNNFELAAMAGGLFVSHRCFALYKPLHNAFFEQKIRKSRSRFGSELIAKPELKKFLNEDLKNQTEPIAILFAMDQWPPDPKKAYWMNFLSQDTGVQWGTEKYAKDYNLPVLFGHIVKEKRGFYSYYFEEVSANPQEEPKGAILEKMTKILEKDILKAPEYWLWTHRRWKHQRPSES
jgi:Kdo2-lipid IVA lauroyltransferase/acyltransferase